MILAGVIKPKDAFGIFTLADSWVLGRREEVGGIMRYGDQNIPRFFQDPTWLRTQPPLGLHYLRRETRVLQFLPQDTCEVAR